MAAGKETLRVRLEMQDSASAVLKRFGGDIQKFSVQAKAQFEAVAESAGRLGRRLAITGGIMAGLSTRSFVAFENSFLAIQGVLNQTAQDLAPLEAEIRRLGANTEFTAGQVADAAETFARAGLNQTQILQALGPTIDAATASQTELARTAEFASSVIKGQGKDFDELGRTLDTLTAASTGANVRIEQLGENFPTLAANATQLGFSFEQVIAAMALLVDRGIDASEAATGLNNILIRLGGNKTAQRELERFGVIITDARGELLPLVDIVRVFEERAKNAGTNLEAFSEVASIFAVRGRLLNTLVSIGSKNLEAYADRIKTAEGETARIATTQRSGLGGALKETQSAFEALQISLVSAVQPAFDALLSTITGLLSSIASLPPGVLETTIVFGALVTTIALATKGAALLFAALSPVVAVLVAAAIAAEVATRAINAFTGEDLTFFGAVEKGIALVGQEMQKLTDTFVRNTEVTKKAEEAAKAFVDSLNDLPAENNRPGIDQLLRQAEELDELLTGLTRPRPIIPPDVSNIPGLIGRSDTIEIPIAIEQASVDNVVAFLDRINVELATTDRSLQELANSVATGIIPGESIRLTADQVSQLSRTLAEELDLSELLGIDDATRDIEAFQERIRLAQRGGLLDEDQLAQAQSVVERIALDAVGATMQVADLQSQIAELQTAINTGVLKGAQLSAAGVDALRDRLMALESDLAAINDKGNFLGGFEAGIQKQIEAFDNFRQRGQQVAEQLGQSFTSNLGDFFFSLGEDINNAEQAFRKFAASVISDLGRIAAQEAALAIFRGAAGGAATLFGDGGIARGGFTPLRAFADGGVVTRPTIGLIGERGEDEAVVPLKGGAIPVVGAGGGSTSVTLNINAIDARGVREMLMEQRGTVIGLVQEAIRNGGDIRDTVSTASRSRGINV